MPSSAVTRAPSMTPVLSITKSPSATTPLPSPTAIISSGIITIVAGSRVDSTGPKVYGIAATAAKLGYTSGVTLDAAGNIFISTDDNMILKVTASTGIITVVAGTGVSGFSRVMEG